MRLAFAVPGPPVPKARARVVYDKRDEKTRSFTPSSTKAYEKHVGMCALSARCGTSWPYHRSGVRFGLLVKVFRSSRRGDWDNFGKAISDACNGVLWVDDRQIDDGRVQLFDCEKGKERVEVEVWTVE